MKQLTTLICLVGILLVWRVETFLAAEPTGKRSAGESIIRFPVDNYYDIKVSQKFGAYLGLYGKPPRAKDYNGYHGGEDIAVRVSTSVYPITRGRVAHLSNLGGLGYLVAIEHEESFLIPAKSETVRGKTYQYPQEIVTRICSVYVHIKPKSSLQKGDYVEPNEPIGTIAKTSLPAHLHFEIRLPNEKRSRDWTLVGDPENWSTFPGTNQYTGYYKDPQKMVDAGLRHPSDFLKSNLGEPTDWKEYKLGTVSFSVPADWKVGPEAEAGVSRMYYTDRGQTTFMVGVMDAAKGFESGKWRVVHYGMNGGKKIEELGTTSRTISIGHMGRLVDSFKAEIAGRPVTVCVLHLTEKEGMPVEGVEFTNWSFALIEAGKHYAFTLVGQDPAFQRAIFE